MCGAHERASKWMSEWDSRFSLVKEYGQTNIHAVFAQLKHVLRRFLSHSCIRISAALTGPILFQKTSDLVFFFFFSIQVHCWKPSTTKFCVYCCITIACQLSLSLLLTFLYACSTTNMRTTDGRMFLAIYTKVFVLFHSLFLQINLQLVGMRLEIKTSFPSCYRVFCVQAESNC
jgi:hypothetical protein